MKERSSRIGTSAPSPSRQRANEQNLDGEAARQTDLSTRYPEGPALVFTPADEARDVAARLAGYSKDAAGPVLELDLPGALAQLQKTGRAFLIAEEEYVLLAINLLVVEHRWEPQLFATTSAGVSTTNRNADTTNYQTPLNIINTLRATQRLPFGGTAEAAWVWNATETLRSVATGDRYTQASTLSLSASVPLLRGAGDVAREDIINARRQVIYGARAFEQRRRELLFEIATDYFRLIEQQAVIANQERSLKFSEEQQQRNEALVRAGRVAEFQLGISASEVLSSRASLANLRESYILAVEQFKVRLGIPVGQPLVIKPLQIDLKEPETTPDQAAAAALEYDLNLQTQRDQVEDSVRQVRNFKNALLPDATLSGGAQLRTDPNAREGGVVYNGNNTIYNAGILVSWPLDRREETLNLRAANIRLEQARRSFEQAKDQVTINSRAAVRRIDLARFSLDLAERRVKVALRRKEEQEIKAAEVTAQQFVETAQAIREAENDRDRAISTLRTAVLNYLLVTGLLRVDRDGQLIKPPGIDTSPTAGGQGAIDTGQPGQPTSTPETQTMPPPIKGIELDPNPAGSSPPQPAPQPAPPPPVPARPNP